MEKWLSLLLGLLFINLLTSCAVFTGDDRSLSREGKAAARIARRLMFKKVRSELKEELDEQLHQGMPYEEYEKRVNTVHNLGKQTYSDYQTNRLREQVVEGTSKGVKGSKTDILAEDPVDLIRWGPLIVDDEGGVKFNPLLLFNKRKVRDFWVRAADKESHKELLEESPIFTERAYKTNVRLRLNFNPIRATTKQDINELISRYRLIVEFEHFSGIRRYELFSHEYEISVDNQGEAALFFNFVIPLGSQR